MKILFSLIIIFTSSELASFFRSSVCGISFGLVSGVSFKDRHLYQRASASSPLEAKTLLDAAVDCDQSVPSTVSADSKFEVSQQTADTENPSNKTCFYEILIRSTNETLKVGPKKTCDEALQVFEWSSEGSGFAFVFNGQVFVSCSPAADAERITEEDGRQHGVFDWIYQEGIFGRGEASALWWSPSGSMLAFASIDDRGVRKSHFPLYKPGQAYPTDVEFAYPMAGEKKLPVATLSIWNKDIKKLRHLHVQLRNREAFHYLFSVTWVSLHEKEQLVAVWANRWQNEISLTICEFNMSTCVLSFEYKYEHGSIPMWAEPRDFHSMLHSDTELFFLLPHAGSDGDFYQHIARLLVPVDYVNATRTMLSSGNFDVKGLFAYDSNTSSVLFLADAPRSTQLHLYSTSATPSDTDSSRCLSCISSECTYQNVELCSSGRHALVKCLGPNPNKGPFLVDLANGSVDASVRIQVPRDGASHTSKTYPVVVRVYAGPGTQWVTEEFEVDNFTSIEHAVVRIDGRGSSGRGWKLKSAVYGKLGTLEVADQLETIRAVLDKYPFLDRGRVAIWGWSYGGFASANAVIEDSQKTLKCAVSVAPVTNFKYYMATYTEKYMGDALDEAYEASSLMRNVSNFAHTKLLLAHGIADYNVQFVNTALFLEELQKNNIPFTQLVYPNLAHDLGADIHEAIGRFLHACFTS